MYHKCSRQIQRQVDQFYNTHIRGHHSDQESIAEAMSLQISPGMTNEDNDEDAAIEAPAFKPVLGAVESVSRFSILERLDDPCLRLQIQRKLSEGIQQPITNCLKVD